jgi:Na+/H+ antiporter NhaD/arsenite permease-like protein
MHAITIIAVLIFLATYLVVAWGRLPGLHVDRTGAALIGASLMVACGVLTLNEAYKGIDLDTLVLLLGMMIVVAYLRLSGFFALANSWVLRHTHQPLVVMIAVVFVSGFFSAFLVNDAICLVMTPLVLDLVSSLRRNPVPYVLAIAMSSNIGSTATITGNPQNILIGSFSHIPYVRFAAALAPIASIGLVITVVLIFLFFRSEFHGNHFNPPEQPVRYSKPVAIKSAVVTLCMIVFFFLGEPPAKVAIAAGAFLLITRRAKPQKIYREIDFPLLLLFAGLFVVVTGIEKTVFTPEVLTYAKQFHLERVPVISGISAVLSNVVSNVPAVLVLKPFVLQLKEHQERAWLALAMSSTLAGNFTILGSVANLIVVERARQKGIEINFWDYFKVGAPLTVITLAIGILFLTYR